MNKIKKLTNIYRILFIEYINKQRRQNKMRLTNNVTIKLDETFTLKINMPEDCDINEFLGIVKTAEKIGNSVINLSKIELNIVPIQGYKKDKRNLWTAEEDNLILTSTLSSSKIAEENLLPGRSSKAIQQRRFLLKKNKKKVLEESYKVGIHEHKESDLNTTQQNKKQKHSTIKKYFLSDQQKKAISEAFYKNVDTKFRIELAKQNNMPYETLRRYATEWRKL